MLILCDHCGATAPPGDVWRSGERVALECSACGHICPLATVSHLGVDAPHGSEEALASPGQEAPQEPPEHGEDVSAASRSSALFGPTTAKSPPSVAPHQCMKCGHRQHDDASCHRCGFVFAHYRAGDMVWEQIPAGDEAKWEQAEALWTAAMEADDAAAHDAFVAFCTGHDLEELAGRKYRFRVADDPADALARRQLDAMLERGKARLLARLDSTRGDMEREGRTLRRMMFWGVFAIGIVLALLFLSLYPNVLG